MFIAPCLAVLALLPAPKVDSFEATLKATSYAFKADKDGDYHVELSWDEEKRSQLVLIRGKGTLITEPKQPDTTSREIWAVCWQSKEKPSAEIMEKLTLKHYRLGAFQLEKGSSGTWSAYYRVDVPEDAPASFLRQAIRITAEAADDMEKELLGTDDF